ncbi:MAG: hypothetical protein MK538_11040, partial [Planctomycetes bacterium]|nr:hypothetical protein [Planctomycetota bacterium]
MARLQDTVYAVEWEREAEKIDKGRRGIRLNAAPVSARRVGRRSKQRTSLNRRRSRVIRKDLGEKIRRTREALRRSKGSNDKKRSDDNRALLPDYLQKSEFGPSPREGDDFGEIAVKLTPVSAPESNFVAGESGGDQASADRPILTLRDRGSVFATATATDEQGKINVNTAPPNVIASLLGVTELAAPLAPVDDSVRLVDGSVFRGDSDSATLDGAVIVQHPSIGTEAITYRQRNGNTLTNCLRGAFFSLPFRGKKTFPRGSLVYDLRGWKIGYHRFWAGRQGGFEPVKLTRFHSIESLRDISKWQIVSLFLGRFSGRELTTEFLEEQGIRPKEVIDFGLDHYLISSLVEDVRHGKDAVKKRYRVAERRLQRLRFPRDVLRTYRKLRGEMAVVELAARLDGGSRRDVEKVVKEITGMVRGRQGRTPRFSAKYLRSVLRNLAEVYKTPGVETLL